MSAPTTPPRCEPPEHLRGVDGWHWVQWPEGPPQLLRWRYAPRMEAYGWTLRTYSTTADGATNAGWRYIAPVTPPAEVEALRAEVMRAGAECADGMVQVATLRARVAVLEAALEELIGPYTGGADSTLDDPYIMERARAALEGKP